MKITKYHFQKHSDGRGNLISVEEGKDIPFSIRRVYYMYGVPERTERGYHAHKKLKQVLICVSGSCTIVLDNGLERETVVLSDPGEGIYIGETVWREMKDFTPETVLMVLASELYDESDYIRDYEEYLFYIRTIKTQKKDEDKK